MKVEQVKTAHQVSALLSEARLIKGFRSFKEDGCHGRELFNERLVYTARDAKSLKAVALVNEESYHLPGYMGIGLIEFCQASSNPEVATKIIHHIFMVAKSLGKGVRNTSLDRNEKWLKPIFESVASQFPTVVFVQA